MSGVNLKKQFVVNNQAKELRDKVTSLYDELICIHITDHMDRSQVTQIV